MKIALYARVSTAEQHPEAQLIDLRKYAERRGAEAVEFVDQGVSGAKRSRPSLDRMVAAVRRREFAAVAVVRLDRLARSLSHLVQLGEELSALEVELVSLTEGLDTSTPMGRALFGMCGVFPNLERELIKEGTVAGLAAAKRRGKRLGRPPVLDKRGLQRARRMAKAGQSTRHIAKMLGISQSAAQRAL